MLDAGSRAWATDRDLAALRRAMSGLDRDAIEMREVSPLGGISPPRGAGTRTREGGRIRRDQLEHAIRAACQIIGSPEVLVIGSQTRLVRLR